MTNTHVNDSIKGHAGQVQITIDYLAGEFFLEVPPGKMGLVTQMFEGEDGVILAYLQDAEFVKDFGRATAAVLSLGFILDDPGNAGDDTIIPLYFHELDRLYEAQEDDSEVFQATYLDRMASGLGWNRAILALANQYIREEEEWRVSA